VRAQSPPQMARIHNNHVASPVVDASESSAPNDDKNIGKSQGLVTAEQTRPKKKKIWTSLFDKFSSSSKLNKKAHKTKNGEQVVRNAKYSKDEQVVSGKVRKFASNNSENNQNSFSNASNRMDLLKVMTSEELSDVNCDGSESLKANPSGRSNSELSESRDVCIFTYNRSRFDMIAMMVGGSDEGSVSVSHKYEIKEDEVEASEESESDEL